MAAKKRGRKRALDDEQVEEIRTLWKRNMEGLQEWRRHSYDPYPGEINMETLARWFDVSSATIGHVLDKTGAYAETTGNLTPKIKLDTGPLV